ncbi:FG-GAP-like repeat-containing protein [Bradyrhizobium sp. WSM1417]|uniref:FG-GAP-like repeat-containing protein n=1 Tax=Bradyrhizobium sp. WSM1417 TaxID=754500 RepID=UPI0004B3C42A|nr:FG-GAP-like repeat-containing protein [Bradyrhizobium sp. WSM1417]
MATAVNVSATNNAEIDGLLSGYKWTGAITYSFPDAANDYASPYSGGSSEPTTSGFASAPSQMQAAINYAIGLILGYTNANIQYAGTNGADIMVAQSPAANPTSYAYYPGNYASGGDVWFGTGYNYSLAALGNYYFTTALHELGHALGLKHSQEAGGPANVAVPSAHDDSEYTVMSYRSYVGASTTSGYTNEAYGYPQTYMANDILALQTMYGADYTTQGGTTVYTWSSTTGQEFINGVGQPADNGGAGGSANRIYETIWDGGGVDTYDLSNYTTNLSINLNPGASSLFSSVQLANLGNGHYASGNVYNSYLYNNDARSYIDNATGGSGNDTILGNAIANTLKGGGGNDTITGGGGNDTIDGGSGTDTAVYSGNEANYAISYNSMTQTFTIVDQRSGSPDGTDTVTGVENFQFGDGTSTLSVTSFDPDNIFIADFNGDQRADLLHLVGQTGFIALSTGSAFSAESPWGTGLTSSDVRADANGDGKADLIQFYNGREVVALSEGSKFGPWVDWATGATATDKFVDVNGDGKVDLVQFYGGREVVALSDGTKFGPWQGWTGGATAADKLVDVNGDGKADLAQFYNGQETVALSDGTKFLSWANWASGTTEADKFADVNGDGKADLVQCYNGREVVALSDGTKFGPWRDWTGGATSSDKFVDVNGDGKADLVQIYNGREVVATSDGTKFGPWKDWAIGATSGDKFSDLNGDGKFDLLQFNRGTAYVALSTGSNFSPWEDWGAPPLNNSRSPALAVYPPAAPYDHSNQDIHDSPQTTIVFRSDARPDTTVHYQADSHVDHLVSSDGFFLS